MSILSHRLAKVKEFHHTAMSKPFVETITWGDLADESKTAVMPNGGLVRNDYTPKLAFRTLLDLRHDLLGAARKPPRRVETA